MVFAAARWSAVFATALATAGCFGVSFQDSQFTCSQAQLCPPGLSCVDGLCRDPGAIADAAVDGPLDASPLVAANCQQLLASGNTESGVYTIDPPPVGDPTQVYCQMSLDGGGWTVLVNNDNADDEPSGCRPRLATTAALACGSPGMGRDFSSPTTTVVFTDLLFAAYSTEFAAVTSYRWFRWDDDITLPTTELWQLVPDEPEVIGNSIANLPLIACRFDQIGPTGLLSVGNGTPRIETGPYLPTDVLTFFDQDTNLDNSGKFGFFDATTTNGSIRGLDDFQDGNGCNDEWDPVADRGSSAFIAVR